VTKILVIAEHDHQQLTIDTLHAFTAAMALEGSVDVLVAGYACQSASEQASRLQGVQRVHWVDSLCYQHHLAEPLAVLIVQLIAQSGYSHVIASANIFGKNLLPRVAALLDVAPISDVIRILSCDLFSRPIYAGGLIETVESLDAIKVLSVRSTAFDEAVFCHTCAPIDKVTPENDAVSILSVYVKQHLAQSKRPELTAAKVIVAGGKGLGSSEQFHALLEPLADLLGAAIGASRSAVDAGYAPNAYQIGQTGKVVAPLLYIAIGISGAMQHLTGMKDSKIIVAINKNPEEPIFQVADYGIVGDLLDIVPALYKVLAHQ